jgi:hypothetical protein
MGEVHDNCYCANMKISKKYCSSSEGIQSRGAQHILNSISSALIISKSQRTDFPSIAKIGVCDLQSNCLRNYVRRNE